MSDNGATAPISALVAQGVPLSGLVGLTEFTNGEMARTSGANPTFYQARLFVRQVIGLSDETEDVSPAMNQLGSRYATQRLTLTAGNLSVLDIFDANQFNHDPRSQFLHAAGRQVVINSLRFPQSVIRLFCDECVAAANGAVPVISLKGSQVGRLVARGGGAPVEFEELESTTLDAAEIDEVMRGVEGVVDSGQGNIVVFYYPRNWRVGEMIWTPRRELVGTLKAKYQSATDVVTGTPRELGHRLGQQPLCMVFLLIERASDERMAYQHTEVSSFFTHLGIDKRHGTEVMARHLDIDLEASIGAGDAPPDTFLRTTGLSVIVGNGELDFRGRVDTLRLPDTAAFGRLLTALGRMISTP